MAKVSVIVPVYNVERFLERCLDSIICQTLKDIEIILIDDGSIDKSGTICDSYSAIDTRIKVIHKNNEGLSCARNNGIEHSTSSYIMFVDSDDWVEPDFCEMPYKYAINNAADLVLFTYNNISKNTIKRKETNITTGVLSEEEAIKYNVSVIAASWVGLYHKRLFDYIRYPEGRYYEDTFTSHKLIHMAKRIFYINIPLYNHRIWRAGSITSSPTTKNHPDKWEMLISKTIDLNDWGYDEYAQKYALSLLIERGEGKIRNKTIIEIAQKNNRSNYNSYSCKQRAMLIIFKKSPRLFDWLCIALKRRIIDDNDSP